MPKKIKEIDVSNTEGQHMTIKWSNTGVMFIINDDFWTTDDPGEVIDAISEIED